MVIPLSVRNLANPRSLKQISPDCCTGYFIILIKLDLDKLAKATVGGMEGELDKT
jgi:hypothetical protein